MERKSYLNGKKIAGIILHQFFTVIMTISVYLLGAMMSKNILQVLDIGTDDFLDSGYYLTCMEQKCSDLYDYLKMEQKSDRLKPEESQRYLQYANQFQSSDTNFCYWYKTDGKWYANQSDAVEGQEFDTQAILIEAKTMGNYLIYDMEEQVFSTNIRGLDDYFFSGESANAYTYRTRGKMILVIGVDTQFSAKDDLYEAREEYQMLQPWIKVSIAGVLIGIIGWILSLVYLTLEAGYRSGENEIYLNLVDKIKAEFLSVGFVLLTGWMILLLARVNQQEWDVSGLLVASGTISFMTDTLFLIFYLSMVRRLKAGVLWESSFVCWLLKGIEKIFQEHRGRVPLLILSMLYPMICCALAFGAIHYKNKAAMLFLVLLILLPMYLLVRQAIEQYDMLNGVEAITDGVLDTKIDTDRLHGQNKKLGEAINNIGEGLLHAVDDNTKNERMKADLITNVSHDLKTPLTSIINYVNLLKREDLENERVVNYVRILDEKSQRLKQLTEDLVEASRISSGNIRLDMQKIDIVELVCQTGGEFNEKFERKELTIVTKLPKQAVFIQADGRQLYRVIENLYNNVAKYALEKTRVYVEVTTGEGNAYFSIKNISQSSLAAENSQVEDLTERFVRGDKSRTTEGSGLGLSIARNLTDLMGGRFYIEVDGDLFKANIIFPVLE